MSHESPLSISVIEPSPYRQTPLNQHHDILHDIPLPEPFPEGGFRAWLVIFGAFSIIMSSFGLQSAIGIFQSYWATHQLAAYSSSEIGWISAVNIFITLIGGVQVGPLFDARGARELLLLGSGFYLGALVALEWCTQYWHFMLVWGIISGIGNALLTTTGVAVVAHWFEVRRGQANGIVFIGSSLGGIVYPVIVNPLFEKLGWAWAMRVLTLIILLLVIIGNVCIKGRLPKGKKGGAIDLRCFKDTRLVWACVGIAGSEFVLFGTLGLLPTHALSQGFDLQTSFSALAVLNGGSAFGRWTAGWLSDSTGRFNTMLLTTLFAIVVIFATWLPISMTRSMGLLYTFSALFGFGSGSIISLAPVCFGQLCKADEYGKYYGTAYSVVGFATLICIPIGGVLSNAGPEGFVTFFGGILVVALLSFTMARWACLDYRWGWNIKI